MAVEVRSSSAEFMNTAQIELEPSLPPFIQKDVDRLLVEFQKEGMPFPGKRLEFKIESGLTAHNPSIPFILFGKEYIAVRADVLEEELTSRVILCQKEGESWVQAEGAPVFKNAEDPSVVMIGNRPVLTFVRVENTQTLKTDTQGGAIEFGKNDQVRYRQEFYMIIDEKTVMPLPFKGPIDMKDIRLTPGEIINISGFGRPKEHYLGNEPLYDGSGDGTISYFEASTLAGITSKTIAQAPLLKGMFAKGEWGGVNQVNVLKNGLLWLIGHIACEDEEGKHYYAVSFAFNPRTQEFTSLKIIATRADFPEGVSKPVRIADGQIKKDYLKDIVFPGGIVRTGEGWAYLFAGLSDAESGVIKIKDPLLEYELLGNEEVTILEQELIAA